MEKGQEAPPSYEQSAQQGYPPPQQGYPQPGYPPQPQGYPQTGYPPPPQGYGEPKPPYQTNYGQPAYGQPTGYPQGYSGTQQSNVIVTTQPGTVVLGGPRPTNWLIPAIFACLCFWPIGICAIITANDANRAAATGDYALAESKSRSARSLVIASFLVGIVCYVVIVVVRVVLYTSYY